MFIISGAYQGTYVRVGLKVCDTRDAHQNIEVISAVSYSTTLFIINDSFIHKE